MKNLLLSLLLHFVFAGILFGQTSKPAVLYAGISKVNITPAVPIPIAWHAGANKVFDGVHDSVFVRAIVFSNKKTKAALISVDGSEFSTAFDDEVFDRLKEYGIPAEHILLSATNTHSGPTNIYSGKDYTKSTLPEVKVYSDGLKEKIVRAVKEALDHLQPVSIGTGRGQCSMNVNRRAPLSPDGYPWLGKNPEGSCDHEIMVLKINDKNGNLIGAYVNWPCQAAVMGPSSNLLTGDWPGATALALEKESGNKAVILVTAGASADIDPVFGPLGTSFGTSSTSSDSYGYILSKKVSGVLKNIKTTGYKADISGAQKNFTLPGKLSTRDMPGISWENTKKLKPGTFKEGPDVEIRLSALRIGSTVFAGITGDVFHEIGLNLKQSSPYKDTFIVTHTNGWCGYIVTDNAYEEGGYEVVSTRIMSGGEKTVRENMITMIKAL